MAKVCPGSLLVNKGTEDPLGLHGCLRKHGLTQLPVGMLHEGLLTLDEFNSWIENDFEAVPG